MELHTANLAAPGVLAAVLEAALPPSTHVLTLQLQACGLSRGTPHGCAARLAATTGFALLSCVAVTREVTLAPALDALLQHMPQLGACILNPGHRLGFACPPEMTLPSGPPPALASLRHLTALVLCGARLPSLDGVLDSLPGGPAMRACSPACCARR